ASNLVAGDTNGWDIFVRDRQTGETTRVSVSSAGIQGNQGSNFPGAISADGRFVAFHSTATNLAAVDTNDRSDVFVHDRQTGETTMVSVSTAGVQGNTTSNSPSISADGRFVAFYSFATNLVAGDTNMVGDIFVHDRQAGETTRASVSSGGAQANDSSGEPSISADGRFVAFWSQATNLVPGDTNGTADIFLRDWQGGATNIVSLSSSGAQGNGGSGGPSMSTDTRFIAFHSYASNLVAGDTNNVQDVFVHDRQTGATSRVSVSTAVVQGNQASVNPTISADGRFVAFGSYASNLVAGDTNNVQDVFVHDRQTGETTRASVSTAGAQGFNASGFPAISVDGRFVAFQSDSFNLVAGDTNGKSDIFVRDLGPRLTVEFTQAIQVLQTVYALDVDLADDGQPPVPIVAKKPAVLRVYPGQVSQATNVTVEVSGIVSGSETMALDPACTAEDRRRRNTAGGVQCLSADFYFVPPVGQWTATVKARDAQGNVLESYDFTLESKKSDLLGLFAVSVCDSKDGSGNWQCGDPSALGPLKSLLKKTAPTDEFGGGVSHQVKLQVFDDLNLDGDSSDCYDLSLDGVFDLCEADAWWPQVALRIGDLYWLWTGFIPTPGQQWYYYGMVRPGIPGGTGGYASGIPGRAAASRTSVIRQGVETNDQVVAHETGHLLGVRHTNKDQPAASCYNLAWDDATDWAYADNLLRSGAAPGVLEVGFDVANRAVMLPESKFELMSYCVPRWVSPRTYLGFLDVLDPPPPQPQGQPWTYWQVAGTISGGSASLQPLFTFDTLGLTGAGTGTHRIEVRDGGGAVLFTRFFTPTISHTETIGAEVEGLPSFSELVPVQGSATSIVVIDNASTQIGQIVLGGTAPSVGITFPTGDETLNGPQTVAWTVSDPDSASHTYQVLYSPDGGATWQSLTSSQAQASLKVDFSTLPGSPGNARIRVIASDGTNTGAATSTPFSVPKKLPSAQITFPGDGSVFRPGELVWLQGLGTDWDVGFLSGGSMQWGSSLDGALGTGEDLPLTNLSEGTHSITLTATDADANQATDSITIQVVASPLSEVPPPPTPTPMPPTPTPTPVPGVSGLGLGVLAGLLAVSLWAYGRRRQQRGASSS
ncbi:MAG: PD40 domain-containing protein, partial [Chloroflexi bacterium]|nr:PD40 domain-containing protein [Chloroflexota bacterium]